jgi:hypothetical protein
VWKWRFSPLKSVFLFMKFIQGNPRNQWEMYCLDAYVDADNEVRRIDLFVDSLNLSELGFKVEFEENGRPAYHPGALLRLFIYGYLNRIHSSRQLNKRKAMPFFGPIQRAFKAIWRHSGFLNLDRNFCAPFFWHA